MSVCLQSVKTLSKTQVTKMSGAATILKSFLSLPEDFSTDRTLIEFEVEECGKRSVNQDDTWMVASTTGLEIKYKDYDGLTRNIASNLYDLGVRKGDVILYSTACYVKTHLFFGGVWKANAAPRASYGEDIAETIRERVQESKVKIIFCDPCSLVTCSKAVTDVGWDVKIISSEDTGKDYMNLDDLLKGPGDNCPTLSITGEDAAVILNTSGTTGKSKGAVWTHSGMLGLVHRFLLWPKIKAIVQVGKPTHISGFIFPIWYLGHGTKVVHVVAPTPENLCVAIERYQPEVLKAFPTYLLALVNYADGTRDLSSLKAFFTGGMIVTIETRKRLEAFQNITAVVDMYGMTETLLSVSTINLTVQDKYTTFEKPPSGVTGKVLPGSLAKVVNYDTLESVAPHVKGELCLKGAMMKGYLNNPEGTAETYTEDGFIRSGDIAYYDENEFIPVCGRAKEIFKYFNNHISPSELDELLYKHPAVDEACTIGVADPEGGDTIPRAFVTLKPAAVATADEIKEFANAQLASYKHLRGGLFIIDAIPKGTTGKISRQLIKQFSETNFP